MQIVAHTMTAFLFHPSWCLFCADVPR